MTPIKQIRLDRGMTQVELSDKSGVSLRTLQNYEQGLRDINGCHLRTLLRITTTLNCEMYELLTDVKLADDLKKYINKE